MNVIEWASKIPVHDLSDGRGLCRVIFAEDFLNALKDLPPAQPELNEWCHDCKEYDKDRHCCPRFNRVIQQTVEEVKAEQPEVIRCKDCKWWSNDEYRECLNPNYDKVWNTPRGFYCGFAERRTDEAD